MSTAVIGAPEWRARSGRTVSARSDGSVLFDHANGYLSPWSVMDAEEFFQAKRDAELGRWRWPENPDYVVYPAAVQSRVRVFRETGMGDLEWVDRGDERSYEFCHAARAYFEAHPERKPWEDAAPGEAWEITYTALASPQVTKIAIRTDRNTWKTDVLEMDFNHAITSARRIWPEDAS